MVRHLFKSRGMQDFKPLFNVAFKYVVDKPLDIVAIIADKLEFRKAPMTHILVKSRSSRGYGLSRL